MILEDQFGDIIQKARSGIGKSKKDIAETSGITPDRLDQLEACSVIPLEDEVSRLAHILDLDEAKLSDIAFDRWSPGMPPLSVLKKVIAVTGDVGGYKVNGYIIFDERSKDAAIIDTANDMGRMLEALKARLLKLRYIFLTHSHHDHIGDLTSFEDKIEADIYIGRPGSKGRWKQLRGGEDLLVGSIKIRSIPTPGHTSDSISFLADDICFVGDTIFAGSIGRANPPSSYPTLLKSIRERIFSLDERCLLAPGHGPITSVGEEKRHNPLFKF